MKLVIYHSKDIEMQTNSKWGVKISQEIITEIFNSTCSQNTLHIKTKFNLPNKSIQNKQEMKSQLNTSAIPHHQHVQCDIITENAAKHTFKAPC